MCLFFIVLHRHRVSSNTLEGGGVSLRGMSIMLLLVAGHIWDVESAGYPYRRVPASNIVECGSGL